MFSTIKRKLMKGGGLLLAVTAAAIIGGATTAFVMAAIPDSNGVIHGCYRNSGNVMNPKGSLRAIDTDNGETCTNQETALNWSKGGEQPISNRISVAYGTANNQTILIIPNLGIVQVTGCDSANGADYSYTNNTGHDILYDNTVLPAGESFDVIGNSGLVVGTHLLGYSSNGVNYVGTLSTSLLNDTDNSQCVFQAQAILSQN